MLALERYPTGFLSDEETELHRPLPGGRPRHYPRRRPGPARLDRLRTAIAGLAAYHLDIAMPEAPGDFLDAIHTRVRPATLNAFRLAVIEGLRADAGVRRDYFELARPALEILVGNELVIQRRLNLSVQLPGDDSALLPVHADVWNGDSPFEVVVWLPLVDCHGTKSMYLLPPAAQARHEADFRRYSE